MWGILLLWHPLALWKGGVFRRFLVKLAFLISVVNMWKHTFLFIGILRGWILIVGGVACHCCAVWGELLEDLLLKRWWMVYRSGVSLQLFWEVRWFLFFFFFRFWGLFIWLGGLGDSFVDVYPFSLIFVSAASWTCSSLWECRASFNYWEKKKANHVRLMVLIRRS